MVLVMIFIMAYCLPIFKWKLSLQDVAPAIK